MASVGDVNPCRFRQAEEIDAAVLKETPVFDGQYSVHHQLWEFRRR